MIVSEIALTKEVVEFSESSKDRSAQEQTPNATISEDAVVVSISIEASEEASKESSSESDEKSDKEKSDEEKIKEAMEAGDSSPLKLSEEEQEEVRELKQRDREVKAHEQAHLNALGAYRTGGATYTYKTGPDGARYAVGGEVPIDLSAAATPEETVRKMQTLRRAALAPAEPSGQDRRVAAQTSQIEAKARNEATQEKVEEAEEEKEEQREDSNNSLNIISQATDDAEKTTLFSSRLASKQEEDGSEEDDEKEKDKEREKLIDKYSNAKKASLGPGSGGGETFSATA